MLKFNHNNIIHCFIKAMVLVIPLSVYLIITNKSQKLTLGMHISFADILVVITFLLLFSLRSFRKKVLVDSHHFLPILLFLFAMILSILKAESLTKYTKEIAQITISFYLFYWVLAKSNLALSDCKQLIKLLIISACFIVIPALFQQYWTTSTPYYVRGLFANRNIYGCYIAILLPLIFISIHNTKLVITKIGLIALTIGSVISILAIQHIIAGCLGILVTCFFTPKRKTPKYLAGIIIVLASVIITQTARIEDLKNFISIYEQNDISQSIRQVWKYNTASSKGVFFEMHFGNQTVNLSSDLFLPKLQTTEPILEKSQEVSSDKKVVKQYYSEWNAAINLLYTFPFTGCGLGNYQDKIGSHYGHLQKNNTAEPNIRNGYLVLAASSGLLGLLAFLYLLFSTGEILLRHTHHNSDEEHKLLFSGLLGSLVVIMISNFFTPILNAQLISLVTLIIFIIHKSTSQIENTQN